PIMSDNSAFLGKTFCILFLSFKQTLGNKKREIGIAMASFLKHFIQLGLHLFPNGKAVRFYYHATPNFRVFCKICTVHNLVVPLRIILFPTCKILCHFLWYSL